jgi:RNA polymerase sigma-70 factor (ECF subfamily)
MALASAVPWLIVPSSLPVAMMRLQCNDFTAIDVVSTPWSAAQAWHRSSSNALRDRQPGGCVASVMGMDVATVVPQKGRRAVNQDFVSLYQSRFADLAAQLYAFTGDALETHDLVQEAFIRAWQRWGKVSAYDDPVAWVRRVAWNLAMTRHRRWKLLRLITEHRDAPPAPDVGLDRIVLVQALRKLPEQIRRAIVLFYIADMSIADIAQDMSVPEGTVKSWLHRGRTELAMHLTDTANRR